MQECIGLGRVLVWRIVRTRSSLLHACDRRLRLGFWAQPSSMLFLRVMADFGQTDFGQTDFDLWCCVCVSWVSCVGGCWFHGCRCGVSRVGVGLVVFGARVSRFGLDRPSQGPPFPGTTFPGPPFPGARPKFRSFFSPLPRQFSFFSFFSLNFGGVLRAPNDI